ncbi:MAG: radical SAM protein [Candidatus Eisenbacteria bacterium]
MERPLRREVWLTSRPDAAQASSDSLTVVLCYPESYELGMSNLGFHAAFRSFAEHPRVHCERAFLERGHALLAEGASAIPGPAETSGSGGSSLETGTPLRDFDVVAFSVSFEGDYPGLARMLREGGVPLRSSERGASDPVVVVGGVGALLNAEPVAPFADAVAVGDASALVPPIVASVLSTRGAARPERLASLASVDGVYVPSLYEVETDDDGTVLGFRAASGAPLPVRARAARGRAPVSSVILSPDSYFRDTFLVETSTGCARACRFCAAGHVYRPVVFHPPEAVLLAAGNALQRAGKVGLVSAALADHPDVSGILSSLSGLGAEITVSSVHADRVDDGLARALVSAGVRTVTLAPETGSERLRRLVGKPVSDETLLSACTALSRAGGEALKLYFMVGLPGERPDDVESIPGLARRLAEAFASGRPGARVTVGVSVFVPKARTPFQWLPMASESDARRKLSFLRRALSRRPRIEFTASGPREARREGVLARGGRELASAIELLVTSGAPWKSALKRAGVDAACILDTTRRDDEVFPWDIVDVGVPKERLLASLTEARSLMKG